jgi:hypothetical protein
MSEINKCLTCGEKTKNKSYCSRLCNYRKASIPESQKLAIKNSMLERSKEGLNKGFSSNAILKRLELGCTDKQKEAARKECLSRTGVPQNINGKTGKHQDNVHAISWRIKSPDNIVYRFKNLSQFIRDNVVLFDDLDVVWKRSTCRASVGLGSLNQPDKFSWKGWTGYGERHG